jgi:hypothetical protein
MSIQTVLVLAIVAMFAGAMVRKWTGRGKK